MICHFLSKELTFLSLVAMFTWDSMGPIGPEKLGAPGGVKKITRAEPRVQTQG